MPRVKRAVSAHKKRRTVLNRAKGYSVLMNGLKKAGVQLDRKVLSDMAINDPAAFTAITEVAKKAL